MKKSNSPCIPSKITMPTLKRIYKDMGIKYIILKEKILIKTKNHDDLSTGNKIAQDFDFYTRIWCNTQSGEWFLLIGEWGKNIRETNKSFSIHNKLK